ncbi:hypothetical protein ACFLR5_01165 [Elusimicrobiota bacterium]
MRPDYSEELFYEAGEVAKSILEGAIKSPVIDTSNINLIGYSLGACGIFKENIYSSHVNKIILIGFGPPMNDIFLFDKIQQTINNAEYMNISTKVLIMVSNSDEIINLEAVEYARKKMKESDIEVTTVEYKYKRHKEFSGSGEHLINAIRFLKEKDIENRVDMIKLNTKMTEKWKRLRKVGYW